MTRCLRMQSRHSRIDGAQALIILTLGFTLLSGCEGEGTLTLVRPEIFGEPAAGTTVVFDQVVLGRTEVDPQIVRVGNRGDAPLSINEVRIDGAGAAGFQVLAKPTTLAPGQQGEIYVRFAPTEPLEYSGTLVVSSNDVDRAEIAWPLAGPARNPCSIAATPAFQNFLLGEIRQVVIQASFDHKCVITGLETDRSLFTILDEPVLPVEIPAGESLALNIQHTALSIQPGGTPTRELFIRELEGTEDVVILAGVPPVESCLSVAPGAIRFPRTERGRTSSRSVLVRNSCSETAAVTSVAMTDGFFFFFVDPAPYPVVLQPQQTIEIPVTYEAFSSIGDRGLLSINTNDATNPQFRIELYGEADVPRAEVFPKDIDFGTVVYKNPQGASSRSECSSAAREVRVYSSGASSLRVSSIELDSFSDPFFQVTSVLVNGQPVFDLNQTIEIPPSGLMQISIQFAPTRTDPPVHNGLLRIIHDGLNGSSQVVLRGTGVPEGVVNDVFQQLDGPTVDILWVIDDSCSMYDEQARLVSNLSPFTAYADSQAADYQMAVTITDSRSSQAGTFRRCWPHPPILRGDYSDAATRQEAFECTFLVGTDNISFSESGLGAAMRALERATSTTLDPATNPNAGFVRPDAKLAIVTVSDEDDQSAESHEVLRDFYYSVKGFNRRDRVSVFSIAGPTTNPCAQGPRFAEPGYRYLRMTQDTGGRFFDICETDWQPLLNNLGLDVFTPLDEWDLSQAADPGSLQVAVDGVSIPSDPVDGYTYILASNSLRFNGASLPAPGAQITATYTGLCRP